MNGMLLYIYTINPMTMKKDLPAKGSMVSALVHFLIKFIKEFFLPREYREFRRLKDFIASK